jgi:hypothetical protein
MIHEHTLATTSRNPDRHALERHRVGEPERIGNCRVDSRIDSATDSAKGRAMARAVDRNHRSRAADRVLQNLDLLVISS